METLCSSSQSSKSPCKDGNTGSSPLEKAGSNQKKRSFPSPASKLRGGSGPSPKRISPLNPSPQKRCSTSPVIPSISPDKRRRSWRRSSMKGNTSRKSLPPIHQDSADLSKSISLELPETQRLSRLLKSCFQFSVKKLEDSLKNADGFSAQAFKAKVSSITEELNHFTERLERDGTLLKCTEEPNSAPPDPAVEESKAQIRDYIERFTKECHAWDQILLTFQKTAMEKSRLLEEIKCKNMQETLVTPERTSQDKVLQSRPNYQRILWDQREVFDCMEVVIDELQQAISVLHSFMDEHSQYLKSISPQSELNSCQQMGSTPLRRLLNVSKKGLL